MHFVPCCGGSSWLIQIQSLFQNLAYLVLGLYSFNCNLICLVYFWLIIRMFLDNNPFPFLTLISSFCFFCLLVCIIRPLPSNISSYKVTSSLLRSVSQLINYCFLTYKLMLKFLNLLRAHQMSLVMPTFNWYWRL